MSRVPSGMSPHLAPRPLVALPGGRDFQEHAALIVHPRKKPPLFDWAEHPDVPKIPLIVSTALSVLIANSPECAHDAANTVHAYFHPRPDWCDPHGIERPS